MADAFSKIPIDEHSQSSSTFLSAISYPYLSWLDDLRRDSEQDTWIKSKIQEVLYPSDSTVLHTLRYKVENGFLRYKD